MSNYTNPLLTIAPPAHAAPHGGGVSDPAAELIIEASRQIDAALTRGREQCQKLRDDVVALQSRHAVALADADRRLRENQSRAQHQLAEANQRAARATQAETTAQQEIASLQARYQSAVQEVERRAREAMGRKEQQLRSELSAQKERLDALQRELDQTLQKLDRVQVEAKAKVGDAVAREERTAAGLAELRGQNERLQGQAAQLKETITRHRSEVDLYKSSWARVLQMEKDARAHLASQAETASRIAKLESRNADLMNEAKARIRDLEARLQLATQAASQAAQTAEANLASARKASEISTESLQAVQAAETAARRQTEEANARANDLERRYEQRIAELEGELRAARAAPPAPPTATAAPAAEPAITVEGIVAVETGSGNESLPIRDVTDIGEEFMRISSSRQQLERERDQLKNQLEAASSELEHARNDSRRMRKYYPLKDLLAHKEAELTRAVREFKKIGPDASPRARTQAEEVLETLSEQREQLRTLLRASEAAK